MRKILESCPTCGERHLIVTQLHCPDCQTEIRSQYSPCPFCRLSAEDLRFLEAFVENRGNVKEMERELDVSYWAIRNRLNEVVESLEMAPRQLPADEAAAHRRAILEQLEQGEIDVAAAAKALEGLS